MNETESPASGGTPSGEPGRSQQRGALHAPHTASGGGGFSQRTVRVPLVALEDGQWRDLRQLAYRCAAFGNHLLSESYLKAKGGPALPTYTDARGELSAAIRDAVAREHVGIWRRLGRKILRGEQTLARFSADRALVCRERGISLTQNAEGEYTINLRLQPQDVAGRTDLQVWMPALKRDRYLALLLRNLRDGIYKITKATVQFERPGRKIFVHLAYAKPMATPEVNEAIATFDIRADGAVLLRGNGRSLSLTDHIYRITAMKEHYAGIHDRLRRSLSKRGRRRDYRRALLKAGGFQNWSLGPLHQFSREIVDWCLTESIGSIVWNPAEVGDFGDFPWARLMAMVAYKGEEVGLAVSQMPAVVARNGNLRREEGARREEVKRKKGGKGRFQGANNQDGE